MHGLCGLYFLSFKKVHAVTYPSIYLIYQQLGRNTCTCIWKRYLEAKHPQLGGLWTFDCESV